MSQVWECCYGRLIGLFAFAWTIASPPAIAQVVPDRTLGAESSRLTQGATIRGRTGDRIDGGAARGANLFHSFAEFNVGDGDRVYFANPNGIENIISRVTGNDVSDILGTLGVEGGANLYLLNPNGIIFGANAQLDIRGAFVASTADGLAFADGRLFNAREAQTTPLLSIAVPVGLQYGAIQPGAISNAGSLVVAPGQRLSLVGGTVTNTGQLIAPGGTVEVLGDRVALLDNSRVDVSSETGGGTVLIGGDFQGGGAILTADRTFVAPGATISADALTEGNGGRVIVWADEVTGFYGNITARGGLNAGNGGFVEVSGKQELIYRGIVNTNAVNGYIGTLLLDPTNITVVNGTGGLADNQLNANVPTPGNVQGQILSGDGLPGSFTISESALESLPNTTNVVVEAADNITVEDLTDNLLEFQSAFALPPGRGGSITFRADADGNSVGSFVMNLGDQIDAQSRNLTISGSSVTAGALSTSSAPTASGSIDVIATFGNLHINGYVNATSVNSAAGSISLRAPNGNITVDNSPFGLDTRSTFGSTGTILVEAENNININGFVTSNIEGNATFDGGNIIISSRAGTIDSGRINSSSGGNGGTINLNAAGNIRVAGDVVSRSRNIGNGGEIIFETANGGIENISLITGSGRITVQAGTLDSSAQFGNGGRIALSAATDVEVGEDVLSRSEVSGSGGAIAFTSRNGAIQTSDLNSSANRGNGGSIALNATGNIRVAGDTLSSSTNIGNGGNVTFESRSGSIQASTLDSSSNFGNGGSIAFNANRDIRITGNVSSDSARVGNGGNVAFTSRRGAIDTTGGTIDASGAIGNGGDVALRTPGNISSGSILTLGGTGVGGDVALDSGDRLLINDADIASITGGAGRGGNIELNADLLRLTSSRIGTVTRTAEEGGDINIDANSVELADAIIGTIVASGNGQGGNIQITNADVVRIRNTRAASVPSSPLFEPLLRIIAPSENLLSRIQSGSGLATTTTAAGEAGDISIDTDRLIISIDENRVDEETGIVDEETGISTLALTGSTGNSGSLTINAAESVRITGNDQREQFNPQPNTDTADEVNGIRTGITSATLGSGGGGDLTITTDRLVLQNGAAITSGNGRNREDAGTGRGGALTINAQSVDLRGFAALATATFSEGRAGNLTVNSDRVTLRQGALFAADTLGTGRAGSIQVTTDNLQILAGSRIGAATLGSGIGGRIRINQADDRAERVEITGTSTTVRRVRSGIFTNSQGDRRAGNIRIFAEQLNVRDRAEVSVSSSGLGEAGNLFVTAGDILLDQQARLRGTTQESRSGGNLRVTADRTIELRNDGGAVETEITTQAATNSDGGRITVTAGERIFSTFSQNSDVVADADRGQGGLVVGDAPLITGFRQYGGTRTGESDFVAGSRQGTPGIVDAPAADVPAPLPDAPDLPRIDQVCPATSGLTTRAAGTSQFLNTGRGGLPPNPAESIDSSTVQVPWVTLSPSEATSDQPAAESSPAVIEEAQGWQRLPSGEFLLTTTATTPLPCVSSSQ